MKRSSIIAVTLFAAVAVAVLAVLFQWRRSVSSPASPEQGQSTAASQMSRQSVEQPRVALASAFARADVPYPPARVALLGLKAERSLEVWALHQSEWRLIKTYPILAASGVAGPKLREGDRQVPEGIYRITWLNPNSSYHLSMKLDYPNDFDRRHAKEDRRSNLGGDIFLHGDAVSIGCIAMGDRPIEELYAMVEKTGLENASVLIAPWDPRVRPLPSSVSGAPSWLPELYERLGKEFKVFQRPGT